MMSQHHSKKHSVKKAPPPFSLSVSKEELACLEWRAGTILLGLYICKRLFDGDTLKMYNRRAVVLPDKRLLAQILGNLGICTLVPM